MRKPNLLPSLKYLRECFILVEFEDFIFLVWRYRPLYHFNSEHGQKIFNTQFALRIAGNKFTCGRMIYYQVCVSGTTYLVHRIIWKMLTGKDPGDKEVDHQNGDGLCNSRRNLRLVAHKHNARNTPIPSNNTSGIMGVSFNKSKGKWEAYIKVNQLRKFLGRYDSKRKAARARRRAEKDYGFHQNHGRAS